MSRHRRDRARALQAIVNDLARAAGLKPPAVRVWRQRNACYNPFLHRINVSATLADALSDRDIRIPLAHEIGHARRRRNTLRRFAQFLLAPVSTVALGNALALGIYLAWGPAAALIPAGASILLAGHLAEIAARRERVRAFREELLADRYAAAQSDQAHPIARVLHECVAVEDKGELGPEALRRIRVEQLRNCPCLMDPDPIHSDRNAPCPSPTTKPSSHFAQSSRASTGSSTRPS